MSITCDPLWRTAESSVWLSIAHPWVAQAATAPSSRRRRSSGGTVAPPFGRITSTTISATRPTPRIAIRTHAHVGVLLVDSPDVVVAFVVRGGTVTRCVVVCSTVVVVGTVVVVVLVVGSVVVLVSVVVVVVVVVSVCALPLAVARKPARTAPATKRARSAPIFTTRVFTALDTAGP
jgi:hypothetical protein